MRKAPKIDKHVNKDIVLCSTTNHRVSRHATQILLDDAIPFTASWKRVPLYQRQVYSGATEVCIFSINRNLYQKARQSISHLEKPDRDRLLVHVI